MVSGLAPIIQLGESAARNKNVVAGETELRLLVDITHHTVQLNQPYKNSIIQVGFEPTSSRLEIAYAA